VYPSRVSRIFHCPDEVTERLVLFVEVVERQYHEWHAWPDYIERRPVSGGDGLAPDPDPTVGLADDLVFGTAAFLFYFVGPSVVSGRVTRPSY